MADEKIGCFSRVIFNLSCENTTGYIWDKHRHLQSHGAPLFQAFTNGLSSAEKKTSNLDGAIKQSGFLSRAFKEKKFRSGFLSRHLFFFEMYFA